MEQQKLDKKRKTFYCSPSIENFREKLKARIGLPEWKWYFPFGKVIFFGMYRFSDYLKFIIHRGEKKIFWCGSDIINLSKRPFWKFVLTKYHIRHFCENQHEQNVLSNMGFIPPIICPMIFSIPNTEIAYKHSKIPHVYLTAHEDREEEYGVNVIKHIAPQIKEVIFHIYGINGKSYENIIFHGKVSDKQFNDEIRNYQASIRLNVFDGFAETTAKSILHGQYPITYIYYPKIDWAKDMDTLIELLKDLKYKKEPNYEGRDYWIKELENNLCTVLS